VDPSAPDRGRALAFLREADRAGAERVEDFPGGAMLLTPRFPRLWDANHVRLDRAWDGTGAELHAAADLAMGHAGMEHRLLICEDEADADRLAPELAALGYARESHLVMALRRPSARAAVVVVEDVPLGAVGPIRAAIGYEADGEEQVVRQVLEWGAHLHEIQGDRWLAAFSDGSPVACARVLSDGDTGQVEDVATLPGARERGFASSVVLGGIDRLRAEGVQLILIVVDRDVGPVGLYRDLGFDPLALLTRFRGG
jgi:ribosomal protein S18 acetylase RimI-like enzyme